MNKKKVVYIIFITSIGQHSVLEKAPATDPEINGM